MADRGAPKWEYDKELGEKICEEIATSNKGLHRLRKENPDWPSMPTLFKWLAENEDFAKQYARARSMQADMLAYEVLEIADTQELGKKTKFSEDNGLEVTEGDVTDHRRLRIDARKWMAGKLAPKKYGDKIELDGKLEVAQTVVYLPDNKRDGHNKK